MNKNIHTNTKSNILVLGDGLLGSELVKQTGWKFISRKKDGFRADSPESWDLKGYDVVVNCIAHTDTYSKDKESHWHVNYEFVHELIKYCNHNKMKLVHISTEYLYSGSIHNATEEDVPVHCDNWYCYTKLLGDGLVQLLSQNYLILRSMHKPSPLPFKKSWIDQIGNFDYVENIASLMISLINKNSNGIFNVGTDLKTMVELAKQSNPTVEPSISPNYVPKDVSMSVEKLKKELELDFELIQCCPITNSKDKANFLNLGEFPLVNNLNLTREESISCDKYPLNLIFFKESKLTTIDCVVDSKKLFSNYLFKSEVNKPYIEHCKQMFEYIKNKVTIKSNDLIIDIGGNDGTLLHTFKSNSDIDFRVLNIDPSQNLREDSLRKGVDILTEFFSYDTSLKLKDKAKVIVSTNVFQHLRDTNSFLDGVYQLLDDEGIWILEFPYWIHDLKTNQYDQVYHEHIYYYSITPLVQFTKKHRLKIVNIHEQKIHGGTLRLTIVKDSSNLQPDDSISKYIEMEKKFNLSFCFDWGVKIKSQIESNRKFILELKNLGLKIAGFGAAAKGCIFLNSLGLTYKEIDYIVDDTDIKQGKFVPGTGIEVVNREHLLNNPVDYLIILTHNFADFIIDSLRDFDGKIITFLPEFKIYQK
jgi:trans-aconitate methyltransferase